MKRQRFGSALEAWEYVDKRSSEECWPWRGSANKKGYGRVRINGRESPAHRVIFQDAHQLTDDEMPQAVCHRCDNPQCCNPSHLFGGTYRDNNHDMHAKGRGRRKLVPAEVVEAVRADHAENGGSTYRLARAHGVSQMAAWRIINRRNRWEDA